MRRSAGLSRKWYNAIMERVNIMKKTGIAVLVAVLLCGCFGTGVGNQDLGGWEINTEFTPVLREEEELLFEQARAADGGYATLIPVTVVATQVVSGMNYAYLCLNDDEEQPEWVIAVIYETATHEAAITSVKEIKIPDAAGKQGVPADLVGGWSVNKEIANAITLPQDIFTDYNLAADQYEGAVLYPLALLARQVVSGTNYLVLAKGEENGVMQLFVTTAWKKADGSVEMNDVSYFNLLDHVN